MAIRLSRKEFDRKLRLIDQMTSMHSLLRDRLERRALLLTVAVLGMSIVATATAFVSGSSRIMLLGIETSPQLWIGALTAFIFFVTLIELKVDWRQRAGAHGEAARRLAELKGRFRAATIEDDSVSSELDLGGEYDRTMGSFVPIPEK